MGTAEEFSLENPKQAAEHTDKYIGQNLDIQEQQTPDKENAIQLSLPFDNVETQSKQGPISRSKKPAGINYETLYIQAQNSLADNQPNKGLKLLKDLNFEPIPSTQRWRIAALRGHCYFGLGMFLPAKEDYAYAIKEMPIIIPKGQVLEAMDVHLKLAYVQRELGNLPEATEQYHLALAKMDSGAQVRHFAEAYWGLALIELEQASKLSETSSHSSTRRARLLQNALVYAKKAKNLYESTEEMLNAVSVSCDIALIEQTAGNMDQARHYLQDIIDTWSPMLVIPSDTVTNRQRLQQYRNVVSAALCYLSNVEFDAHLHSEALFHAQRGLEIAKQSNVLRHAEAAMNLGKILSNQGLYNAKAEESFREAIDILTPTDFLAARVRAHNMLGHYLISHEKILEGKKEIDKAYEVSCKAQGIPL